MLGVFLSLLAALGFGISSLLARVGLQRISTSRGTLISLIAGLIIAITTSLIFQFHYVVTLSLSAVLWFALVGVVNFGMGRYLNFEGLRHIGAARATVLFSTSPVFAMTIAVLFIGERLNAAIVIGCLLIIGGVSVVMFDAEKQ